MNKERIAELADYIENQTVDFPSDFYDEPNTEFKNKRFFWMSDYVDFIFNDDNQPCGTAACVAGSCLLMYAESNNYSRHKIEMEDADGFARDYLELTWFQAKDLFNPTGIIHGDNYMGLSDIKKKHAIFVLREMAKYNQPLMERGYIIGLWCDAFDCHGLEG